MRTPAGKECRYFYGDYYRGRSHEECRLLMDYHLHWTRNLCSTCPVPGIIQANACQFMELTPTVTRKLPLLKRQVKIAPHCAKTGRAGFDPHIGCGQCHPLPPIFEGDEGEPHPAG